VYQDYQEDRLSIYKQVVTLLMVMQNKNALYIIRAHSTGVSL